MNLDGISALIKFESLEIHKALYKSSEYSNSDLEFSGHIISTIGEEFFSCGINPLADVGSKVFCTIKFTDEKPDEIANGCIGSMSVSDRPKELQIDDENPVIFKISITLPKKDFADFMHLKDLNLRFAPTFLKSPSGEPIVISKQQDYFLFYIEGFHLYHNKDLDN